MIPAPFQVILDANILFPFTLRDTLLRAAERELYLIGWSRQILEEMRRNLVSTGHTTEEKSHTLVSHMRAAFPEAEITGYEFLIPTMPNDERDRHIAAAAVKSGAQLIVTSNMKHFRTLPEGVEAKTPGDFLLDLQDLAPGMMAQAIIAQAAALKRPPRTVEDVLRALEKFAPEFVKLVRSDL